MDNENENLLEKLINEKLTEMFGTGKPLETSKKTIMDGVMAVIKQHNDRIACDFHAALQRFQQDIAHSQQTQMKQIQESVMGRMFSEIEGLKESFKKEHEKAKEDILNMRREFLADLRTL